MATEKKSRIIYLLKYLYAFSDEDHPLSTPDIIAFLESEGFKIHRTTIKTDVELLVEAGIDVEVVRSSPNKYFIANRDFELPELKIMVDAIASSKIITPKKTKNLIEKIQGLTSSHQAKELERVVYTAKAQNEKIYYSVDRIQNAIQENRQISFLYVDYDPQKQRFFRNGGKRYEVSPYTLLWQEDRYYAVGYSKKHEDVTVFRVDRMENVEVEKTEAVPQPEDYKPENYANQTFGMFDGELTLVDLKCTNEHMRVIVDKFGEEVNTRVLDNQHFRVQVPVKVSPKFYGWIFAFAGDVQIIYPPDVKEKFQQMAQEIAQKHQG